MNILKLIIACLFTCSACFGEVSQLEKSVQQAEVANHAPMEVHYQKDLKECVQRIGTVRRAAFDFGGGSFRVLVADVDVKTKKIEKLFCAGISIKFRLDLSKNPQTNRFSEEIQKTAFAALDTLLKEIAKYSPQQFYATATEAFRIADNGSEFLQALSQETNVPIEIIDQVEEGHIGFLSGIAYSSSDPETTVVLDLGTGSAQITAQNSNGTLTTHGLKLGVVVLKDILAQLIRNLPFTPDDINPVTKEEALAMIHYLKEQFTTLPEVLVEKLQSKEVRVVATCDVLDAAALRSDSGWEFLLDHLIERKTSEGVYGASVLKGIFCYSFIHKFGVEECLLVNSNNEGNTSGMLITERFWN